MEALKYWAQTQGVALAGTVLKTVIIAVIGILIIRIVMRIINKALEKSKFEKAAFSLIKTLARTIMGVLLALILASSLGIDVTGVVALASVVSLAISLRCRICWPMLLAALPFCTPTPSTPETMWRSPASPVQSRRWAWSIPS